MSADLRSVHWSAIRDRLTKNRAVVYDRARIHSPFVPTELATAMGWSITSLRPRTTDLYNAGLLETTGVRRDNQWELKYAPLALAEARARAEQERGQTGAQLTLSAVM